MTKEEIIKKLRDMAKYPTVTMPRDTEALRNAADLLEQAQQVEPVAWRNAAIRVGEDLCSVGPFGYYDMTAEQWLDWALSVVTVHAPPRQPLTDEQIDQICGDVGYGYIDVARAIEAAVWEKQK